MTFYLPNHLAQCIGVINDCFKVDWEEAIIFRRRGQQGYKFEVWIGLNFWDCVIASINININECLSFFIMEKLVDILNQTHIEYSGWGPRLYTYALWVQIPPLTLL